MLLNFWLHQIALVTDIKQAFLRVMVKEDNRDAQQFLWVKDYTTPTSYEIEILRMQSVTFEVIASPHLLTATIPYHLQKDELVSDHTKQLLLRSFCVDDLLIGGDTLDQADVLYRDVTAVMARAGMQFCKWKTSCKKLKSIIGDKGHLENRHKKSRTMQGPRDVLGSGL